MAQLQLQEKIAMKCVIGGESRFLSLEEKPVFIPATVWT